MLAGSNEKEASLIIKYAKDDDLLIFRDIASDLLAGKDPLPELLIPFHGNIRLLAAAQTATDVRRIFIASDTKLHANTSLEFFSDLADANEREGDILMRSASEKH